MIGCAFTDCKWIFESWTFVAKAVKRLRYQWLNHHVLFGGEYLIVRTLGKFMKKLVEKYSKKEGGEDDSSELF